MIVFKPLDNLVEVAVETSEGSEAIVYTQELKEN